MTMSDKMDKGIGDVKEMKAVCIDCGDYDRVRKGISVWWDINENKPKGSVTFLCDNCEEATKHEIKVKWETR